MVSSKFVRVSGLLFASGFCALLYQTVWFREFRLVFGASTSAHAAVLAIFMGGLGTGSLVLGRRIETWSRPWLIYSRLEWGITITAALSPWLLDGVRSLYLALGGSGTLGGAGATGVRLLLSTLVIFPPAFLMGGTLPALSRVVTERDDGRRRGIAVMYGWNTVGAVAGVIGGSFLFFPIFGFRTSLLCACLLNAMVALIAGSIARKEAGLPVRTEGQRDGSAEPFESPGLSRPVVLLAAAGTGFVFFLSELVWYRIAAPLLGGSTYTFAVILGFALFGVGVGGLAYSFGEQRAPKAPAFALTCSLQALFLILPFAMGDDLAVLAIQLRDFGSASFPKLVVGWALVSAVLVFPAAVVSGYQFPLLVALRGGGSGGVSTQLGEVYAVNTLGAIAGSLAGGFGLLPALGAIGTWKLCSAVLLGMGAMVVLGCFRLQRATAGGTIAIGILSVLAMDLAGPSALWRHTPIGAGRKTMPTLTENELVKAKHDVLRRMVEEHEGRESSVGFGWGGSWGLALVVNGKSDGSCIGDARTQVGVGLLPAFLHEEPKNAYVIGLGSGQTAGWLADVESMERVDVAEIEPSVVRFAKMCEVTNRRCVDHPKVHMHLTDGRESLATLNRKYDIIASEPSNPYRAGVASFYTREFYELARSHLTERGLLAQWVQAYEVDPTVLQIVLATIRSVFPHVTIWGLERGDLLLIASNEQLSIDMPLLRRRFEEDTYRTGLGRIFGVDSAEGVLGLQLANDVFTKTFSEGLATGLSLNYDDNPVLEFMFARSVGSKRKQNIRLDLMRLSEARGERWSPRHGGGGENSQKVDMGALMQFVKKRAPIPPWYENSLSPELFAFWRDYANGGLEAAAGKVETLPWPPVDELFSNLVWMQLHLIRGPISDGVRPTYDARREVLQQHGYEGDVAWIDLFEALVTNNEQALMERLPVALEWARKDPWLHKPLIEMGLSLLRLDVESDALAQKVATELMREPFCVYSSEMDRRLTLLRLVESDKDHTFSELCVDAFGLMEPYPLWEADFLENRYYCYRQWDAPGRDAALEELLEFKMGEGVSMETLF